MYYKNGEWKGRDGKGKEDGEEGDGDKVPPRTLVKVTPS